MSIPIALDWIKIDEMLKKGHEGTHIAAFYGINPETLYRRCQEEKGVGFVEYRTQKRALGDAALLDTLYDTAVDSKNVPVMIFLAKNRLGMRDIPKDDNTDTQPITKIEIVHIDIENAEPVDGND